MVWGSFTNCEVVGEEQIELSSYYNILQHHTIPSETRLVGQGFILMWDNDPKHTSKLCQKYIKSKREQHILQLMSWPVKFHWTGMVWTELKKKSELNNPQVWLTSDSSCKRARQNCLQSTSSLWWKENLWSNDSGQSGSF